MECAFTSPVIIELGMLVMYCMQFLRSCMSVLMACGVLMCVNAVSYLM